MNYRVKEVFYTLQGEGAQVGRAAVFCRFAGCNLWSGRESARASAACTFCDSDFVGTDGHRGGKYATADSLAEAVAEAWGAIAARRKERFVVCTGGEPLLQLDVALLDALHGRGFEVAVETNGTQEPPPGLDWVCVSPKAGIPLIATSGDEIKLVYPQEGADPGQYEALSFKHRFLQPLDNDQLERNTRLAADYCLRHPAWRLSLQTHKLIGLP